MLTKPKSHTKVEGNFNKASGRRARTLRKTRNILGLLTLPALTAVLCQDQILELGLDIALRAPDKVTSKNGVKPSFPPFPKLQEGGVQVKQEMGVKISEEVNPDYRPGTNREPLREITIDGFKCRVYPLKDRGTAVQTEDGKREFYIGTKKVGNTDVVYKYSESTVNTMRKLTLDEGCFMIPNPYNDMKKLIDSGYLDKHGLKLVGVAGTGYNNSRLLRSQDRRVGFIYNKDTGVSVDTLDKDPLRRGYYVQNGKMYPLDLTSENYRTTLNDLLKKEGIEAIDIFDHAKNATGVNDFAHRRFRAPYLIFDDNKSFLGLCYTSEADNDTERNKQIKRLFPNFASALKLDGDVYSGVYFVNATDPVYKNSFALVYENQKLIVSRVSNNSPEKREEAGVVGSRNGGILSAYYEGIPGAKEARRLDLESDTSNPDKVALKISAVLPNFLKGVINEKTIIGKWLGHKIASNPKFREKIIKWQMRKDFDGLDAASAH